MAAAAAAARSKHTLNSMHTAGIFSDMTADGPQIGTLVAIVDRAKNLPNRKTIGKQDPYCAARLGKEARKTTTDIRGGQTPKWDQELRYTVHDSPDYYQLKVSVFNDDKKTDLIGETWIDLRDIIVPGGGQSDQWHNLTCRGKYAGEVRMEITYYDTRPKPEKPAAKPKPVMSDQQDGQKPASRTPVKRRPLPSDPVTGEAPAPPPPPPASAPEPVSTPPRALPKQPGGFVSSQSALQAVEYNTHPPAHRHQPSDPYPQSPHSHSAPPPQHYGTPPARADMSNPHTPRSTDRHDNSAIRYDDRGYSPRHQNQHSYDRHDARGHYSRRSEQFDPFSTDDFRQELPADDEKPPPPPVHRSRHNSAVASQDMMVRSSHETPPKGTPPMRHDILKQEAHRRAPSYPGRPAYKAYDSAPAGPNLALPAPGDDQYYQPSPPRHDSYDHAFDHRSMQATVEDVPESPTPAVHGNQVMACTPQHNDAGHGQVPSPAPLNLGGRGSTSMDQYNSSPQPSYPRHEESGHQPAVSPLSMREYGHSPAEVSQPSHSSQSFHSNQRTEMQGSEVQAYGLPSVPSSLVPGVDSYLAQEAADRIQEEKRQERRYTTPNVATPPRGRQPDEYVDYGHGGSPQPHTPQSYDRSALVHYSGASQPRGDQQMVKARSVSPIPPPNPHHTIKRKSVSPAPPPPEAEDGGRLAGVPFGPDSYDALNPSLATEKDNKPDPDAKIITYDGKEIDPSDHLPMDTWAPEPEAKAPKAPSPDARPRPGGAQPMPPSGRRPLRIAGRPHSQSAGPSVLPPSFGPSDDQPPTAPESGGAGGRNRLQKKARHPPALPAPSQPAGSSPLGPSSHNHQDRGSGFTPPRLPRASTWDHPNENHAPQYGSSPGGGASRGSAPPVPAKVPLPVMSGGLVRSGGGGGGGGGEEWALMQEMSRIDIGAGRSRRHGGY